MQPKKLFKMLLNVLIIFGLFTRAYHLDTGHTKSSSHFGTIKNGTPSQADEPHSLVSFKNDCCLIAANFVRQRYARRDVSDKWSVTVQVTILKPLCACALYGLGTLKLAVCVLIKRKRVTGLCVSPYLYSLCLTGLRPFIFYTAKYSQGPPKPDSSIGVCTLWQLWPCATTGHVASKVAYYIVQTLCGIVSHCTASHQTVAKRHHPFSYNAINW